MTKITVVIPTYKPQDYLFECLESLRVQTLQKDEFEVILILNGCTDPWEGIIEEYLRDHPDFSNLKFLHSETAGVSNARNLGLDNAQGEFITFIDDDDYVSETFLFEMLSIADSETMALCYPYSFKDGSKQQQPYSYTSEYESSANRGKQNAFLLRKYFNGSCMKLIHRSIIGDRRFEPEFKNGEDSLFMMLISDRFQYVDFTSHDAVYYRRIRNGSAFTAHRTIVKRIHDSSRWIAKACTYYFSSPQKYNFLFFAKRILASAKSVFF